MAVALPDFEVEHQLCSANMPTAPHGAALAIDQALDVLQLPVAATVSLAPPLEPIPPVEPVPPAPLVPSVTVAEEEIRVEPESLAISESKPAPDSPARSKSRTATRSVKRHQSKSAKLFEAFRSRRVRIMATVAGVLFVVGLIGWNWQRSGQPQVSDELAEMDLSEFQDDLHISPAGGRRSSEPRPLGEIAEAEAASLKTRFTPPDSEIRLPPVGLADDSEPSWPTARIQTVGGVSQPVTRGSQAAWLTGQIEIESLGPTPSRNP